ADEAGLAERAHAAVIVPVERHAMPALLARGIAAVDRQQAPLDVAKQQLEQAVREHGGVDARDSWAVQRRTDRLDLVVLLPLTQVAETIQDPADRLGAFEGASGQLA